MKHLSTLLIAASCLVAATAAAAQTVWRCGDDGRSFSDKPCSDGRPLAMSALADARSDEQIREAREVAARERRLAETLRQQRLARESVAVAAPAERRAGSRRAARAAPDDTADDAGAAVVRPTALKPAPTSRRAQAPRLKPAGDGTSPAAARASRRNQD